MIILVWGLGVYTSSSQRFSYHCFVHWRNGFVLRGKAVSILSVRTLQMGTHKTCLDSGSLKLTLLNNMGHG